MPIIEPYIPDHKPVAIHPIVLGPLMRGTVSLCVAMPGVGKSTWAQAAALAISHEHPALVGEANHSTPLWPGPVIVMAAEDPKRIMCAKFTAMEKHYGLLGTPKHQIFTVSMAGQKLFALNANNQVEFIGEDWLDELIDLRGPSCDFGLIVIDTLSSCLHGINESNPEQMQAVMDVFIDIAKNAFCSILLIHHASKVSVNPNDSLTLYSARGSSVVPASVRSAFTLSKPTKIEAAKAVEAGADPKAWVKFETVKASYSEPSATSMKWFKFITLGLPAYDPRDQSQHTLSMGVLEYQASGIPQATTSQIQQGAKTAFSTGMTPAQAWPILKSALMKGQVFARRTTFGGKVNAKDLFGLPPEETDALLAKLEEAGAIRIPNKREREIVGVMGFEFVIESPEDENGDAS